MSWEIKTAEEFVIRELEKERRTNEELSNRIKDILGEKALHKFLLTQICKNIVIKESQYFGRYFDFDFKIAESENRNLELFKAVVDFMKENGIIKDEVPEEKSDE